MRERSEEDVAIQSDVFTKKPHAIAGQGQIKTGAHSHTHSRASIRTIVVSDRIAGVQPGTACNHIGEVVAAHNDVITFVPRRAAGRKYTTTRAHPLVLGGGNGMRVHTGRTVTVLWSTVCSYGVVVTVGPLACVGAGSKD